MENNKNNDSSIDGADQVSTSSDTQIRELRLEKVVKLRESGRNPYPSNGKRLSLIHI